jgi:hypothetical protein
MGREAFQMSQPKIKLYPPHFDRLVSNTEAEQIASSPESVARHAFMPFLQRNEHWTKYKEKGKKPDEKTREIRYACRLDSYIFAYYRNLLWPPYEQELKRLKLGSCVTAYRKIATENGRGGKCNIHFAKEAFDRIQAFGDCLAFALDIKKFFENLNHEHLKQAWWRLLGKPKQQNRNHLLPEDHFAVFKAVTSYSYISMEEAYKTLGYIGEIKMQNGKTRTGYLVKRKDFPKQICSGKQFREKLASKTKQHSEPFGIPQGSPISDLLANIYLLDFDYEMQAMVASVGGVYRRYSDDILIILPGLSADWQKMVQKVKDVLHTNAPNLQLKEEKTQVYSYAQNGKSQENKKLTVSKGPDGLEYLGFRYDGKRIVLRNSTVSGIQRKITLLAHRMARKHLEENRGAPLLQLINSFNYSLLISKFGRVKDFDSLGKKYTKWTFWTYVKRSTDIMGIPGKNIARQMRDYRRFAKNRAERAMRKLYR